MRNLIKALTGDVHTFESEAEIDGERVSESLRIHVSKSERLITRIVFDIETSSPYADEDVQTDEGAIAEALDVLTDVIEEWREQGKATNEEEEE